jgi:hypothetical protein
MAEVTAQPGGGLPPVMFRAGADPGAAVSARAVPASAGPSILLADVSEYQANIADAAYLRWSKGIAFRAMYGTTVDRAWYGGGRRDGLHAGGARFIGMYQYLTAGQDAAAQAHALVNLVGNLRQGEKLVCDIEEGPPGQQAARWRQWSAVITAAYGRAAAPWLYAGLSFSQAAGLDPQWVAAYRAVEPPGNHLMWQFSASYPVPGVGTTDCNRFRGSIDELAALGWQTAPVKPPAPDWTFGEVRGLAVTGAGPHSVALSWSAPGTPAPEGIHHYQVTVRHGGQDVPGAQATVPKGANPQAHQVNGLTPGTAYEALVRAADKDGKHSSPWATVGFSTS